VTQRNGLPSWIRRLSVAGLFLILSGVRGWTQEAAAPRSQTDEMAVALRELRAEVRELRGAIAEMRSEAAQYRAETQELRRELQASRSQTANVVPAPENISTTPAVAVGASAGLQTGSLEDRVASLEETSELLSGKVSEQYQTKVESASKYRMRMSGIVLLNLFRNRGSVDNQDFPTYATPSSPFASGGTFGASLRQSELGLEVFGPRLAGARTTGNLQVDFAGGFAGTSNGLSLGLLRLRTANMRLDWDRTSLVVGQDNLFFSPLAPTSFASLAVPALSYQGNLWGWIPQIRIEHRIELGSEQRLTLQAGILDNLTGEPPYTQAYRLPQAGERSGQPADAFRVAWTGKLFGQSATLGGATYYSRQNWGFNRDINGWAGMADWDIAFMRRFDLSGEFYRGAAIGGLGGGIGRSVVYGGSIVDPTTQVRGLNSVGGWSQLKFKATSTLEFNGAFGMDNPLADDARLFPPSSAGGYVDQGLVRNRGTFVNFVYRPRSNLLFSTEYHHMRTLQIDRGSQSAEQINAMMGILF
jgi:hypothetical protein